MAEPNSFDLRVEFSGLCLYVKDPSRKKVGLLMPDARFREKKGEHPDGTPAEPHVAYVRFDLANLASPVGGLPERDPSETPSYEVIHQFGREDLQFVLPEPREDIDASNLALPNFDEFAPVKELLPGLFAQKPPGQLLARMVLRGGALTSILEAGVQWRMSGELHPQGKEHVHVYGGEVHWRQTVNASGLVLRFGSLDGNGATEITLRPSATPGGRAAISLKVANLCARNPLEWQTYEPYGVEGADKDFKWLYRLLQLKKGEDPTKYPPSALPHPHPIESGNMGIFHDCFGGMITAAF